MYQKITFNTTGKWRYETLDGERYVVAPAVIMKEGVWRGSQGRKFYPGKVLGNSCPSWNHKPVVINHPKKGGEDASASDPEVIDKYRVGIALNTDYGAGKKQRTEFWLNEAKTNKVDRTIIPAIKKGQVLEVSTGLYTEEDDSPGKYGGEAYDSMVTNVFPDHIAILTEGEGAFSKKDGGGLNTNKRSKVSSQGFPGANVLGIKSKGELLRAIKRVDEIDRPEGAKRRLKAVAFANGWFSSIPQSWRRKPLKEPVAAVTPDTNKRGVSVKKDKLIARLIANGDFSEEDRPLLEKLDREKLAKMLPESLRSVTTVTDLVEKHTQAQTVNKEAEAHKKPTFSELLETADPDQRDFLTEGMALGKAYKAELVEAITKNQKCQYTKAELEAMKTSDLRRIAALAAPEVLEKKPPQFVGNSGGAPPLTANEGDKPTQFLPLPNWNEKKASA